MAERSDLEKYVLNALDRVDFKNIKKDELLHIASALKDMNPAVAQSILAQYPELIGLIKGALTELNGTLESIIKSDDESTRSVFNILNKHSDNSADSRTEFFSLVKNLQDDISKCLDDEKLTPEQRQEILDRAIEVLKIADKKDTEIREHEKQILETADKKDSEKKKFNWALLRAAGTFVMAAATVGSAVLGANINVKLPKLK